MSAAAASPEFVGRPGAVLERLHRLYPALIDLSLGRLQTLLARLDHPERRLPPVIHVAGTNGKGSTCASLRAIAESSRWRVHVGTSPHLVDIRERFRVAGSLVTEAALTATLEEIERVNGGAPITVFEVLTAAGFLLFSREPADLAVIEVGLGGRFDATNVLPPPAACVITAISMDHEAFLGDRIEQIAAEKAGIIKPGAVAILAEQPNDAAPELIRRAAEVDATVAREGMEFGVRGREIAVGGQLITLQGLGGTYDEIFLPLHGAHQAQNAACALAAVEAFFGAGGRTGPIDTDLVREAFAAVTSPGRLEPVRSAPTWPSWRTRTSTACSSCSSPPSTSWLSPRRRRPAASTSIPSPPRPSRCSVPTASRSSPGSTTPSRRR